MDRPLHVLAVEPFYGGSHRAFLEGIARHSRHRWSLVTGKPVHWKWRSRSSPLELSAVARRVADSTAADGLGFPDVVFCSEMLDLPTWRGFLADSPLATLPTVAYFHENQWTYPVSPKARVDFHFGYSNLLTALSASAVWFNSAFHQGEFLRASREFVRRMPDTQRAHDFDRLSAVSEVFPPGFDPPQTRPKRSPADDGRLRIGWVSRWEYDKRPDRFATLLEILDRSGVEYSLVLAGPRPEKTPRELDDLQRRYASRIIHDGFLETRDEYWQRLSSMDIVISTADHEFFGIAICEATWSGAVPVLPRRLAYPEIAGPDSLYDSLEQAGELIVRLTDPRIRNEHQQKNRLLVEDLTMTRTVARIDDGIDRVAAATVR